MKEMTVEEQITELSKKIDNHNKEDERISKRDRFENLTFVLWGFYISDCKYSFECWPTSH